MTQRVLALRGIDGTNPLGFLAAVGTLVALTQGGHAEAQLWWQESITWTPVLAGVPAADEELLANLVADALTGATVSAEDKRRGADAEQAMEAARRKRDRMAKKLRGARRGRRGPNAVSENALRPFEQAYAETRRQWLEALRRAVPRPELALGRRIDCTPNEYREYAASMLRRATRAARDSLDLLAAFGSDAGRRPHDVIEATPLCFITGSGHQDFLDTVRALIDRVTPQRVRETLFQPWVYRDAGLSMRWDPAEDKRYALLDADPGEAGVRTVWMANLLAYRGLALFPAVPTARGLATTGWNQVAGSRAFSWPLWHCPARLDSVRSLLQLVELAHVHPDMTSLRARGIAAVYRSQRIAIGVGGKQKINFTQARRV